MVSWNNPRGRITNSDMETAGTILHQDVLGDHALVAGETCHNYSDNTPSVARRTKGSATTTKATAAILRYAALHRRRHQSRNQYQHLSGDENYMGDNASRLWNLSDSDFLTYFNRAYPQPKPWKLCHPTRQTSSAVISILSPRTSHKAFLRDELQRPRPRTTIIHCRFCIL